MRGVLPFATQLLSLSSVTMASSNMFPNHHSKRNISTHSNHNKDSSGWSAKYTAEEFGTQYTDDYQVYLRTLSGIISPFHDVPLFADKENSVFNMVVEIPRWTNAKMEISTKDRMNPIKQDTKKGKVRFVANSFPYKGYIWNYGAIPQTWENPNERDHHTGEMGDGDPIDIIDIGYKISKLGEVKQVKVLGVLGLVDDGETDWKVISIDVNDPLASQLDDIDDVSKVMPGLLEATRDWFGTYKIPGSDAGPNVFAFNGEAKGREFAVGVIMETHDQWKRLIFEEMENVNKLSCENVEVVGSPYRIGAEKADDVRKGLPVLTPPAPLPHDIDIMYYLTEQQKRGEH